MGEAKHRFLATLAGTTALKSAAGVAAAKRAADRGVVGVGLLKFIDDAVMFGLEPIDAVRALHHALAATVARYYGAAGAAMMKPYGAGLPALVAQYAEAREAKSSPLILAADGSPAIAASETETKH